MGINTAIRNDVLNCEEACSHAFKYTTTGMEMKHGVMVMDMLTDLHSAFCARTVSHNFTGFDLYKWFIKLIYYPFKHGCHTVIVCVDDGDRVPKQKGREQKRRDNDKREDPLPDEAQFCDGGVQYPSTNPGEVYEFNIHAALANRKVLRKRLLRYLLDKARREFRGRAGITLVFDHFVDGAVVYQNERWGIDPGSKHPYGEADLAVMYWINRLWPGQPANYYIRSVDTDFIPICLNFLTHRALSHTPKRGLWIRAYHYRSGKNKGKVMWMNMRAVYRYVVGTLGWSVFAFVVYCCMCGTDYTDPCCQHPDDPPDAPDHSLLFRRISASTVFDAFQRFDVPSKLDDILENMHGFGIAVRAVYTHVITNTLASAAASAYIKKADREVASTQLSLYQRKRGGINVPFPLERLRRIQCVRSKLHMPTDTQLYMVYDELKFNLNYWMIDWKAETTKLFDAGVPFSVCMDTQTAKPAGIASALPSLVDDELVEVEELDAKGTVVHSSMTPASDIVFKTPALPSPRKRLRRPDRSASPTRTPLCGQDERERDKYDHTFKVGQILTAVITAPVVRQSFVRVIKLTKDKVKVRPLRVAQNPITQELLPTSDFDIQKISFYINRFGFKWHITDWSDTQYKPYNPDEVYKHASR